MPKQLTYRYKVTGPGQFPDDMLRYDRAKIVDSYRPGDRERMVWIIEGKEKPTVGRWNSFLWSVSNVEVV